MPDFRPQHHITVPSGWHNDPNGLIEWNGVYHVFYQYNPVAPVWGPPDWGHAASTDLVSWQPLPTALRPTPDSHDAGGCWSGCAVDDDGVPTFVYTGVVAAEPKGWYQSVCLARGDADLVSWQKDPHNPVIPGPPPELSTVGFRDPFVWREGDEWQMVIGSGIEGFGGAVLRYRSRDLIEWTYEGILLQRGADETAPYRTGTMWECPSFVPVGEQHALIVSVYDDRGDDRLNTTLAFLGVYRDGQFTPERLDRFDYGPDCYAPLVMTDRRGRLLAWGWSWEGREVAAQHEQGWASTMTFPRELYPRTDGRLGIRPVAELAQLRGAPLTVANLPLDPDGNARELATIGDACEIALRIDPGQASAIRIETCASPDREETMVIEWDRDCAWLSLDRSRSSLDPRAKGGVHGGAFDLAPGELLDVRIFFDRSIVEVYANGWFVLTARIYPTRKDRRRVTVAADGEGAIVDAATVWALRASSDDAPPASQ